MRRIPGLPGLALAAALLLPAAGRAFDFYTDGPWREGAPRPEAFLGYELGSLHTHHFRMQDYFEALAASVPERMRLVSYGESYEKKELFYALISSEANLERVDGLRARNAALADPRRTSRREAAEIAAEAPIFVWLDYGNDGNESAALEAAMQVAYQLAAGESEEVRRLRRSAVVIVEPDHNPESHDRHVAWYNAFGIGDPEPLSLEHHAPWGMSTNNNHYQIDLNRDAWGLTQRENQAIAREILRWRPQVFVDHHGQTENYFFPPPVAPVNPSLPKSHGRWFETFGRGNARAFDLRGWQYYVRDVFDLFYPGYWDSWPSLHGAIGMTYETDGGGGRGLAWRRRDGSIVTFREGIARHFVASLATLRTAVENREALLVDFHAFFADAMEAGRAGDPARAFALDATRDPRRSAILVATLLRHGVEVRRAEVPFSAGAASLAGGERTDRRFPAGTYVVDMAQPEKRMAETLLAPEAPMEPGFVERQLARWGRNARRGDRAPREGYEFYDLTAWSLPLAFGIEAWALAELPAPLGGPRTTDPERGAGGGGWDEEICFPFTLTAGVVARISGPDSPAEPIASPARAMSAYLFRPGTEGGQRLLAQLLREGFRAAVAGTALRAGTEAFPRGTIVLQVDRNPESLHDRVHELALDSGVPVVAADTAFPAEGQTGTGSNPVVGLRPPRIGVAADEGVWITDYGAAWFTLERRLGYPFTPLRFDELRRADLDELDVLVLPQGWSVVYRRALGEEGLERLGGWIERGGTLIGWGDGPADLAAGAGWVSTSFGGEEAAEAEGTAERDEDERARRLAEVDAVTSGAGEALPVSPTADPGKPQPIPGAVVAASLDPTHWLTLGFGDSRLPVPIDGDRLLEPSRRGENPVVIAPVGELAVAGYLWPANSERWLAGRPWALVESKGRGQVVLFAHDPNFRLVWRSTSRLFANALLLGPTLGTEDREGL